MKKWIMVLSLISLVANLINGQSIISYTSFEEPSTGEKYYDTGDAGVDHPLINNTGQAPVNYDPGTTSSELGFSSYYTNTLGDVGLTDGDYVGVTNFQAASGVSYPDGDQGFQLSDCDGLVTVTLDTVDLSSANDPSVSCYYFIKADGYEAADYVKIWVIADGTEIILLNTNGSDIDDLGIEGSWIYLSQSLSGYSEAVFKFELQSNSGTEQLFLDYIVFADGDVNIPPTANAGVDQSVPLGAIVNLDGSNSSDLDGSIDAYAWTQLTGNTVTLTGDDQVSASFNAPPTESELSFELLVTDDGGEADRDTINVSVVDVGSSLVFISQYVEGSSNNKYIEIFNGGNTAIDLSSEDYTLARDNNADMDFTDAVLSDWGSMNTLAAGAVIVLAAENHAIYSNPDTVLAYNSPVHFNGNDAVALLKDGVVVDIVGELGNSEDHIKDMTLTRNTSITQGNPTFSWSEWIQSTQDEISGLGTHSIGGPIADAGDDQVVDYNATVTLDGAGSTDEDGVIVGYLWEQLSGTNVVLSDYEESTVTFTAPGESTTLEFRLSVIDNDAQEATDNVVITVGTTTIYDIQFTEELGTGDDCYPSLYNGQSVTISGVVTAVKPGDYPNFYLQDPSLNTWAGVYVYDTSVNPSVGDEVTLTAEVDEYNGVTELKYVSDYSINSSGNSIEPYSISTGDLGLLCGESGEQFEGMLVSISGTIDSTNEYDSWYIDDGSGTTKVDDYFFDGEWTMPLVGDEFLSITGIVHYHYSEYVICPRNSDDIQTLSIDEKLMPTGFALVYNYPNPFNPTTTIRYELIRDANVKIYVHNISGQKVTELVNDRHSRGKHEVKWNGKNMSGNSVTSGVYFYTLHINNDVITKKMILMK